MTTEQTTRRVYVYPNYDMEDFGARRFEVEWQTVKPSAARRVQAAEAAGTYDELDHDTDLLTRRRFFPLEAKAKAIEFATAKAAASDSAFGCATITEQVVDWFVEQDRVAEWVDVGEPEYVP